MKFTCPQCGAPLNPRQADCFFVCTYCGNSLFLDLDALMQVTTFGPGVNAEEAPLHVRRHLKESALDEGIALRDQEFLFIPFWHRPGERFLQRASGSFPDESITMPAAPQQIFLPEQQSRGSLVLPVDTKPDSTRELRLVYMPFHRILVSHKHERYSFLCDAISGTVYGAAIPREPENRVSRLFLLFMSIFLVMFVVDATLDTPWVLLSLNAVLFFLAFQISLPWTESRLY